MNKTICYAFLITAFFPWISFRILELDTQPYYIILSICLFFLYVREKIAWQIYVLLLSVISSIGLTIAYGKYDVISIRAILSYAAIFLSSFAYYLIRKKYLHNPNDFLIKINCVWLAAGFIQIFFSKDALSFLLTVRTSDDRGVTGLAPEPTFYGMYLIFLSWLIIKSNDYNVRCIKLRVLLLVNIFAIAFIAKSSMALMIVFILVAVWLCCTIKLNVINIMKIMFVGLCLIIALATYQIWLPDDSRIKQVFNTMLITPKYFFYNDASANQRLKNIVIPVQISLDTYMTPHGYHAFGQDATRTLRQYSGYFWWGGENNKIMSGWGGVLYELGYLSIPIFIWCFSSLYRIYSFRLFVFESVTIILIMLTAIPIAFPLFSFVVVESHFMRRRRMSQMC